MFPPDRVAQTTVEGRNLGSDIIGGDIPSLQQFRSRLLQSHAIRRRHGARNVRAIVDTITALNRPA